MLPEDSEVFTIGVYMEFTQKKGKQPAIYMMEITSTTFYGEYAY